MYLKEIGWGGIVWICLAHDRASGCWLVCNSNDSSGAINCKDCFDCLINY